MVDYELASINPRDSKRVWELERQQLEMIGMDSEELEDSLPELDALESEIDQHPMNYLGVYLTARLVGFSVVTPWLPEDDIPFMTTPIEKGKAKVKTVLGRHLLRYPIGIHRLAVDQELTDVEHFRTSHSMVHGIAQIADQLDAPVHTVVLDPANNKTLPHLIKHNFRATQRPIVGPDGTVLSSKYVRARMSNAKGKTVRSTPLFPHLKVSASR